MAFVDHQGFKTPLRAASAVSAKQLVTLDGVAQDGVIPVGSTGQRPIGSSDQASAAQGAHLTVYGPLNVVKAVAGASLGYGAEVGVASTNGALGPVAGASGVARWAGGQSLEPAAAGETFSLFVNPRQLSGLV